ncbi:hypothetical protein CEXT_244481 [Caerostris extrusa]|uniref:Uncharacterized protein n=1 Tax=Caerostris extrusa TaxID=172846 RepID=A0AAV4VJK7_CAEEX|nr:hypothetical protein CEXT_244481 [Caerostris extrusa]
MDACMRGKVGMNGGMCGSADSGSHSPPPFHHPSPSELFSPFEIQNDAIFESALRGRTRVPSRKKQWCTSAISRLPSAEPTWRQTPVFTIPN